MKIKNRIIILIIFAILLSLIFIKQSNAIDYNYRQGYIYNSKDGVSTQVNLAEAQKVYLTQRQKHAVNGNMISVLQQPNIYCLERGKRLGLGEFKIGVEKTVKDPILEYILYYGPDYLEGGIEEKNKYTEEKSQNALWHYIHLGNNDNGQLKDMESNDWEEPAEDFYKEAEKYKNEKENKVNIKSVSGRYNAKTDKLEVTVKGNFKKCKISVGGYATKTVDSPGTYIFDSPTNSGNVDINVIAYGEKFTKYTVKYRILTCGSQQKLLVVTSKSERVTTPECEASTKIYIIKQDVDVSLQKYITHVNNIEVFNRADRKATDITTNQISKYISSRGTNKYNDIVYIEAGDYVTYKITVYNNSTTVTAKEIIVTDTLPACVTKYSINGRAYKTGTSFSYTIKNLAGGGSTSFTVKAYFGKYETDTLQNKAQITACNPTNKPSYRTEDYDYVQMRKYSVSLEKYITKDTSTETTSGGTDISDYYDIINYLSTHSDETIDNLISKWNGKTISFDEKYDLNNDKKIDENDLNIFKKLKNITSEDINKYTEADLNKDGCVDDTDLNIYKIVKANLFADTNLDNLDNNDRYMFILKSIYDNSIETNNVLNYLYVQRLLIKTQKSIEEINGEIDSYLKSDVNEDGDVYSDDNYKIESDKVKVNGEEYNLNITDAINNIDINGISELLNDINKYDMNGDSIINNADKEFLTEYKEFLEKKNAGGDIQNKKYYYINQMNYQTVIDLYEEEYDFNRDNVIDYTDYEILNNYINLLKFCYTYGTNTDSDEQLIKEINSYVQSDIVDDVLVFDMNDDKIVNFEDYVLLKDSGNEELINGIKELLTIEDGGKYDLISDGKVNYEDYEKALLTRANNISNIIDQILKGETDLVNKYSIFDEDSNNKELSQEDVNVIKVYKGWKEYNESYNLDNFDYTLYDINNDGLLNINDKALINKNYDEIKSKIDISAISNLEHIDSFITFFISNYKEDILSSLEIDSIFNTYEDLDTVIKIDEDVSGILNNSYPINVSFNDIRNAKEILIAELLDTNSDGNVTSDDVEFLNNNSSKVSALGSFDETIITNSDINGDEKVDNSDIAFAEKLKIISGNTEIKNAIIAEISGTNNSGGQSAGSNGQVNGRANHPIYAQNNYSKENNPVRVEPGDIITYTIKLTNTGKYPIKVTKINDVFDGNNNADLEYQSGTIKGYGSPVVNNTDKGINITINNPIQIAPNASKYLTLQFKVKVPIANTNVEQTLVNTATVEQIINKNNIDVSDSHETDSNESGTWNNTDSDWVKTRLYKVSLEKFVTKVTDKDGNNAVVYDRDGDDSNLNIDKSEHKYDNKGIAQRNWKYNNPVTVSKGDKVTYTIKVKNDGDTFVKLTKIIDYLPNGIKYKNKNYTGNTYCTKFENRNGQTNNKIEFTEGISLNPGDVKTFTVEVEVIEPNISNNILKNVAEIISLDNKNTEDVLDVTGNNNKDSDYIQMEDIIISGTVWNDRALNKTQNNYNGIYDYAGKEEKPLENIKVYLYKNYTGSRYKYDINNDGLVDENDKNVLARDVAAEKQTLSVEFADLNGDGKVNLIDLVTLSRALESDEKYARIDSILITSTTTDPNGKYEFALDYIKGPKATGTNRWAGTYYSYYVVFEYDGITYTSTAFTDVTSNNTLDSNAREKLNNEVFDGLVNNSRTTFNNSHSTINNSSEISYKTVNEKYYIPQSIHTTSWAMQSSTKLISLSNNAKLEQQLQHVNLGLRGRDIFDLELTSDVARVDVTVNGQPGTYNFTNKVTIRRTDLYNENSDSNYYKYGDNNVPKEDAANVYQEGSEYIGEDQTQKIRTSDLNVSKAETSKGATPYDNGSQSISSIFVTYKITVQNTSRTQGTATKVIDYYDKEYSNPVASLYRKVAGNEVKVKDISIPEDAIKSGTNYNSVELNVGENIKLNQSDEYYIYLTLTMNVDNLKNVFNKNNGKLNYPTFNMAEITEYKTYATSSENEYTRGLLDKDSAPGSANTEQVRLTTTEGQETATVGGNPTTVQYYFNKKLDANKKNDDYLEILKYEDDTYATPTLYFVADEAKRKITGTVFEDYTKLINNNGDDELIRVKTGDGKQDKKDNVEPGIKGATVELYEIVGENKVLRYREKTKEDGNFKFEGFLPGNYIIKYHYGDTNDTFLLDNNPNTKSYNGEDFQSTNNTGSHGSNKLRYDDLGAEKEFWYAYNKSEGISTATDIVERRQQVSTNVTGFNDDQMTVLNNARDGKNADAAKVNDITVDSIREATKMEAQTNPMLLTVEETVIDGSSTKQKNSFSEYNVSNMNFGIAEVPVTTIDLQKHVYSFRITDSTGKNPLAALERDLTNTAVTVNPSKIAVNRLSTVIKVLSENLNLKAADVEKLIDYNTRKNINENVSIKTGLNREEIDKLNTAITNYSLAREMKIVKAWKVTSGSVIAAPGAEVLDVSIEDEKLQGAKLEVTYEITATISSEKNFNNDAVTVPSIEGILDYIDNNLSYNENSQTKDRINKDIWSIAKQSEIKFGEEGTPYGERFGTLDPEGKWYNTILSIKSGSDLLLERCGTGTSYITLEKVLSSNDTTIQDIIMNNVEIYEYKNSVEITSLDYTNQQETGDGSEGENAEDAFIYRDRIRTADRYIILAGRQHDSAISETITIHPPTGDSSINIMYYVIAVISLVVLSAGVFGIKKLYLKNNK